MQNDSNNRPRAVIDTNIFVSGVISAKGVPAKVLDAWSEGCFLLLISERQLNEVVDVLERPHIVETYHVRTEVDLLYQRLNVLAERASTSKPAPIYVSDPKDKHIVVAALESKADYLVTGDKKHLLSLAQQPELDDLKIVTAQEFLEKLG